MHLTNPPHNRHFENGIEAPRYLLAPCAVTTRKHPSVWQPPDPVLPSVTLDKWVLEMVNNGYLIQFLSLPPSPPHPTPWHLLQEEIIHSGAVEPVLIQHHRRSFYSNYSLMPKKSSGWRPSLDMRTLNKFVRSTTMIQHGHVSNNNPNTGPVGLISALNLLDACFHITIHHLPEVPQICSGLGSQPVQSTSLWPLVWCGAPPPTGNYDIPVLV